jgi:[acyl-carrier-protein] S-malonyltransferase
MAADGASRFVEFGPGRVLSGLLRKIDRGLEALNIATADALAQSARAN